MVRLSSPAQVAVALPLLFLLSGPGENPRRSTMGNKLASGEDTDTFGRCTWVGKWRLRLESCVKYLSACVLEVPRYRGV